MCLHDDDLYIRLGLAVSCDCLHDYLYIPLASAIYLDRMCLHDNDLYIPLALEYLLTVCASTMMSVYPLGLGNTS